MTTGTLFNDIDVAESYARHRGSVDETFIDHVASAIGAPPCLVADVGSGTGGPADALRRRGFDVVAIEPSPAMAAQAKRLHSSVRFVHAVGEELPLRDATVDAVTLLYVLHHAEDPESVLAEARRVLRRGGVAVVASGNHDCARQRLFTSYFPTLSPDLPSGDEIVLYGRAAGLDVHDVRTVEHWVYPHRRIDRAYVRMIETEMFATLRSLNEVEFTSGLARLRADVGTPLPPAEVSLVSLRR